MQEKTKVSCNNPRCHNLFDITVQQKQEILTDNYLKYGKISMLYCCKACQENHNQELKKSNFFENGKLKNHESALVRKGARNSTRWKQFVDRVEKSEEPDQIKINSF